MILRINGMSNKLSKPGWKTGMPAFRAYVETCKSSGVITIALTKSAKAIV